MKFKISPDLAEFMWYCVVLTGGATNGKHNQRKKPWSSNEHQGVLWRRGRDSNPCGLAPKRFSRPPRYDRFDTSPSVKLRENGEMWLGEFCSSKLLSLSPPEDRQARLSGAGWGHLRRKAK